MISSIKSELLKSNIVRGIWQGAKLRKFKGEHSILASIESPSSNLTVAEKINIKGWALSPDGAEVRVRMFVNANYSEQGQVSGSELCREIELNEARADVLKAYGIEGVNCKVGFNFQLDWKDFGKDREIAQISIELDNGVNRLSFGPITVNKVKPYTLGDRGNYKEVWNRAAYDGNAAKVAVAGFYDEAEYESSGEITTKTLLERLQIEEGDVVLEIGCGTGRIGKSLAGKCKKWIGTDISGKMIDFAKENLKGVSNVELIELSSCALDKIESGSVDKLYCSAVFMHLDEWDRFKYVREAYRVLKSGGIAYFDNLNLDSEAGWKIFVEHAEMDATERPANISKYSTDKELLVYLERAGFQDVVTRTSERFVEVVGKK
jgi:ubiquinone/menaquinone biosynthesis C-methylase UbiE